MSNESQLAFEQALKDKRLSKDKSATNYVGDYMYMGHRNGKDQFKHINTREYLN